MPHDFQRDLELVALGAALANSKALKPAFDAMKVDAFGEKDVAMIFEDLKRGDTDRVKQWLTRRGATVNGAIVQGVIDELGARAKRRRLKGLANRLSLALAAGCEEEAASCIEALKKD